MMGKLQMDREWTEQDLRTFAEGAQAAFETVLLDELPQDTDWQDEEYLTIIFLSSVSLVSIWL